MEGTLAQILMFAGNFAPRNWAFCNGQILAISQNTALFSILGTMYGGNGQTTFALPDFQGRVPIGAGQGPGLPVYNIGEASGAEHTTLTSGQLPAHIHGAMASVAVAGSNATTGESGQNLYASTPTDNYIAPGGVNGALGGVKGALGVTGNNQPMSLMQPFLGMNFVICLSGVFPARN